MQIRHDKGHVVVVVEAKNVTAVGSNEAHIYFSEEDASQLVNVSGQSALQAALNAAKTFNYDAKRKKIDQLKMEIVTLEKGLLPTTDPSLRGRL